MTLDMTSGSPMKRIVRFALPLMFSMLLQQLYTFCDSLIVGRFLGAVALTATGAAGGLHWFVQNLLGCAVNGFSVALSQRFGARDRESYRAHFAGALVLALGISLCVCILGTFLPGPALALLDTPEELMPEATAYLKVLWLGFWVTALMNSFSTALLSMGDSRTPLISLAISSAVNILLDILVLAFTPLGVAGAALATVIAQGCAAAWNFRALKRNGWCIPQRRHFRLRWAVIRELLRLGVPQMVASVVINIGGLAVQKIINGYGVLFVMGLSAAQRYFSMLNIVGYGLEVALGTYVGQNWGAGDLGRIRRGVRAAVLMGLCTSLITGAVAILGAEMLIRLLLPDAPEEAIRLGTYAFRVLGGFLWGLYMLCEFRAAIQGMGNALYPMLSGVSELVCRLAAVLLLPKLMGQEGLFFTDPGAWIFTMLLMVYGYGRIVRREEKKAAE